MLAGMDAYASDESGSESFLSDDVIIMEGDFLHPTPSAQSTLVKPRNLLGFFKTIPKEIDINPNNFMQKSMKMLEIER